MAKKGVSKNGGSGDIDNKAAKCILAAVSNGQEYVSFGDIDISKTDPNSVNDKIKKLLDSGIENPYSRERILDRRKFGKEGAVGATLDQQLNKFKELFLGLIKDTSNQSDSPPQDGALPEVLRASSVSSESSRSSLESASSATSEGSYDISDSNSSAKKRWFSSFSFSGVKDLLAKICGSSKKEDSLHGSVTADFAVSNKHDDFTLTEERMARERVAKDMRLEEQRRVREALLRERQELEKQRERDGRSERQALQQKSQAPEQRGKSMFERGWSALKNFRGPEALVVTAHQRKDKDSPWKQTSQTEIRPEDLKNGAIAAVRGVRSTITGAATGAATVAKNVGAGAGFMASGWKDGATYL
ncbi:hypothetical protein N9R48_00500 [Rickettsiales bacterium]|nr:hypothetical protein [Rickettsiales bacterium]